MGFSSFRLSPPVALEPLVGPKEGLGTLPSSKGSLRDQAREAFKGTTIGKRTKQLLAPFLVFHLVACSPEKNSQHLSLEHSSPEPSAEHAQAVQAAQQPPESQDATICYVRPTPECLIKESLRLVRLPIAQNDYYRGTAIIAVIRAQVATGNLEGAQNTLNQSTDISELSLNAIAEAQAKLGDIPSAINTVLSIESADNRNAAIRSVFESQIDIVDALKTAEALSYPGTRARLLRQSRVCN